MAMSEFGMAKEPEISHAVEPKNQTPKIEKKKAPSPAKPARKPDNDKDSTTESSSSAKTLQTLQKRISHIDEATHDTGKHLKMLDRIQVQVSQLERRISMIERTSQETLDIVQRIKIKKKKGKKKNKK